MLNVYKCSGIGRVDDIEGSKYQYYTGLTNEATNTVAFNYLLARINGLIVEYEYLPADEQVSALNDIDVIAVALEGLALLKEYPDKYDITLIGNVISSIIAAGKFEADFTDDQRRADNLDQLVADFTDLLVNGTVSGIDEDFNAFWTESVVPYNYNQVTDAQLNRYNELITDKEKVSGDDKQTLAEYMIESGPGFLYMFIPDNEVKKYNSKIRVKRNIEFNKSYDYIRKTTYGMYNDDTILEQLRMGCILKYKMTPERKLQYLLDNGGKIGVDPVTMATLELVMVIISIISALFALIMQIFQLTYSVPDGYDQGVPSDEDLNEMLADTPKDDSSSSSKKWVLFGGLGLLGFMFFKK